MKNEVDRLLNQRGGGTVPNHVEASWARCLENYNLLPDVMRRPAILTHQELQQAISRNDDVLKTSMPEVERLFNRLVDNEYMVSLASPEGVMLAFRCDHQFLGEMSNVGVIPGSIWTEESQGTNGIGTCLKIGRPLSIIGGQHFDNFNRNVSCTTAPIFGAEGAIIGIVNVTSVRPVDEKTARIVRDITERSARRIESRLFTYRHRDQRMLRLSADEDFSDSLPDARLAIDQTLRVVDMTEYAASLLQRRRDEVVGQKLESLLSLDHPLTPDAVIRAGAGPREIFASLLPETKPARTPAGNRAALPVPPRPAMPDMSESAAAPITPEELLIHPRLTEQITFADRMLRARLPLLIQGETGTGKTSFAHIVARRCGGEAGQIILLNCATLSDPPDIDGLSNLKDYALILDHLSEASPGLQSRLLQLLSHDFDRATRNVHLIAIASEDLEDRVRKGQIRADLYHRLKGAIVGLEALRMAPTKDRQIRDVFAQELAAFGKSGLVPDAEAQLILETYHWPGNLREARHAARHAAILAQGTTIRIGDLPRDIVSEISHHNLSARSQSEASRIEAALRHNGGNVSETARYLGVSRATLYRKIQISNIRIKN